MFFSENALFGAGVRGSSDARVGDACYHCFLGFVQCACAAIRGSELPARPQEEKMNQTVFPLPLKVDFRQIARGIGTTIRLPANATVFREGDVPDNMYIILDGAIDIVSQGVLVESIGPCDSLGIVSLLDGKPRGTTAAVAKDAELVAIDRKNFRFMVESVPHFVWYVMGELVGRLRATDAALDIQSACHQSDIGSRRQAYDSP
jgi:CRP/FNR family transcriptional regulator, cyclic AMP receptor protein